MIPPSLSTGIRTRWRWRTRLRGRLPWKLTWLAPKHKKPCKTHMWYRQEDTIWACYDCTTTTEREWMSGQKIDEAAAQAKLIGKA